MPACTTRTLPIFAAVGLLVTAGPALADVPLPDGQKLQTVDFERHVMGLFGKAGCNSGSCHGSFQGKNGFRLSLFGLEPDKDYAALTRDNLGRRIDPVNPDNSLLLLKAVGAVAHEGGARFGRESWQYQVFREWIRQGAGSNKGSGTVTAVTVTPPELAFGKAGEGVQVRVKARFADGAEAEITPFCDFRAQDDSVAEVTPLGVVTALRPGDTAVVVSYRGNVQAVRALVPMPAAPGFTYPTLATDNPIDAAVFAKLRRLNMVPSGLSSDAEFLRRVTVDTIGCLPTPEEVREFLADTRADKRDRKIDELLAHPLHAALWATKFSDVTGNNTDALENPVPLKTRRSQMWHDWFRKRLADNVPYDQIIKNVLTATSLEGRPAKEWIEEANKHDEEMAKGFDSSYPDRQTLDLFWRRQAQVPSEQWGEKVAAAFLGVRLECAQCHKHPTDRWTQSDYRAFANVFAQVAFVNNQNSSPDVKKLVDAENASRREKNTGRNANQLAIVRELFLRPGRPNNLMAAPDTGKVLSPKALGGPELAFAASQDVRADLWGWMAKPDNPFFAKSFVNRAWAHYTGVGIVDPVDDFSLANPPSNPQLLDALAREFVEHKFDIRHLERTILRSRTYQLTATPNETNRLDRKNYAHAFVRPMMAEVVVDVLNSALGSAETYGNDAPTGKHVVEVGASRLQNANVAFALRIFGRPPRTTACDCERAMDPALPQTLYRMTDQAVLTKLNAPDGRLAKLLKTKKTDAEVLEELFLATVGRFPTESDKEAFAEHRKAEPNRAAAFTDTLWSLINLREFVLNH